MKSISRTDCVLNNSKPKNCDQTDLQAYLSTTEVKGTTEAIGLEINVWRQSMAEQVVHAHLVSSLFIAVVGYRKSNSFMKGIYKLNWNL